MNETRHDKAQRLCDTRRVRVVWRGRNYTRATVAGDHATYDTETYADGRFRCDCAYGDYHNFTANRCSHALALQLTLNKEASCQTPASPTTEQHAPTLARATRAPETALAQTG